MNKFSWPYFDEFYGAYYDHFTIYTPGGFSWAKRKTYSGSKERIYQNRWIGFANESSGLHPWIIV